MTPGDPSCPCTGRNTRVGIPEPRLAPGPMVAEIDCAPRCDIEMVANTTQGLVCAISRMPTPMQQQIFTQVGLPNDDLLYSYLRKMNPATKQQLLREILAQNPPTKPEMVEMLRHYDASARRQIMTEVGCDLDKTDVTGFLQSLTPVEIKTMLDAANIKLVPNDEEMIEVMASYANEVIRRILKRIDYTPCKDEIVKGLLKLCPDEQMQVIAQTNVRPPATEESVHSDMRMLRPDAAQRIVSSFGNSVKTDEDMVTYLASKSDEDKERLVKMAGLEVITNTDPAIIEAFCGLLPAKQKLAMKTANVGCFNYDDLVQGLKETETHKQNLLIRDAGLIFVPNEQELISAVQNQSVSVKRQLFYAMDLPWKKADLLEALKEIDQNILADILHEVILFGGAFKLNDVVTLLKNLAVHDQQAIIDMAELKIVPTEQQLLNAFTHKPPGAIFKLIKQIGLVPNKKNMLSLLLDFAEHQQGVPDLLRALRRAGIDVVNDEELIFALGQRTAKQQEEVLASVDPDLILCNIENVAKKFKNLSAVKQKRWIQILRGHMNGASLDDILETLEKMDSVELEHFLKLCRDRGIIQGHSFNKDELIETLQKMDTGVKMEALEEVGFIPSQRHLIHILKTMDEYDVIRGIRTAGVCITPTLEEAICTAGKYNHEEVSKTAFRLGVCLITEQDVIGYVSGMPDNEKRRIAKACRICLCDFQDILNAFRCLSPQKQKEIACAAGLMKRKLRLIR